MTLRLTNRGAVVGTLALIGYMWLGSALATKITGVSDLPVERVGEAREVGQVAAEPEATPVWMAPPRPTPTPTRASRTRPTSRVRLAPSPLRWDLLAHCESTNNPRAISPSGKYRGLYQFDLRTWRSVGGTGDPINASRAEQTYRAQLLYQARGRSPWPSCGRLL